MSRVFIYFIQSESGGPIKVGRAKDPQKRLEQLQVGNPAKLKLCRAQLAPAAYESWLHQIFAHYRLRGEWFRAHPTLARVGDCVSDPELAEEVLDLTSVRGWMSVGQWFETGERDRVEAEPEPWAADDPMLQTTAKPITYTPDIDPLKHGW